ncbi:MAG: hypothetical protein mread185_000232 [Mycoplasmataceae bacterium]|nr:MAG: hypothetical protein mread185_000232 [Mycoplasmataceae bacterium]
MYVVELSNHEKVLENPNCGSCYKINKKFNDDSLSSIHYRSRKKHKFAYKLKILHIFKKNNNFDELRNYKHHKSGKFFNPPQHFFMLVLILN